MPRVGKVAFALGPLLAATFWGGMYVVSKWGFGAIPPVTLGFFRLVLGAAVLLVVVRVSKPGRSFTRGEYRRMLELGSLVALTIHTQFVGTDLTTASGGALLTVLTPVFTLLLGAAAYGEPLTRWKVGGMGLAAIGTGIVIGGRHGLTAIPTDDAVGVILLVVASLGWAGYTVWGRPLVRRYSALEAATYSTAAAVPLSVPLVPLELAVRGTGIGTLRITPLVVAAVLYLGVISTAAAWYCWYKGLEFVDSGTVAVFFFAQPVVGAILGAVFLGERLGPGFLFGGLVMAIGVYVVSVERHGNSAEASAEDDPYPE